MGTGYFRQLLLAMVIALVSQWMIQFPQAYVLSRHTALAAEGLWWSFPVANVAVALISLVALRRRDCPCGGAGPEKRLGRGQRHPVAKIGGKLT